MHTHKAHSSSAYAVPQARRAGNNAAPDANASGSRNFSSRNSLRLAQSTNVSNLVNHNPPDQTKKLDSRRIRSSTTKKPSESSSFQEQEARLGRPQGKTSAIIATTNQNIKKPPVYPKTTNMAALETSWSFDHVSNFKIIDDENFIVHNRGDLLCFLCGTKNRRKSGLIQSHLASDEHNLRYCDLRHSLLDHIPPKDDFVSSSVRVLITDWYNSNVLSEDEVYQRYEAFEEFQMIAQSIEPSCFCRLHGSLILGTSLRRSNINVELVHDNDELFEKDPRARNSIHHELEDPEAEIGEQFNKHTLHYDLIPNSIETLHRIMTLINSSQNTLKIFEVLSNHNDLNGKFPKLTLKHCRSGNILDINCYSKSSYQLYKLLTSYIRLEDRAGILSLLVKHWTNLGMIDRPEMGSYPPYTFTILVIYYLQRVSPPILPCLHELFARTSKPANEPTPPIEINSSMGDMLTTHMNMLNLTSGRAATDYSLEPQEVAIEVPDDPEVADDLDDDETSPQLDWEELTQKLNWRSENQMEPHELFLDFLLFMIGELNNVATVISIRSLTSVTLASKSWITRVKAIEHPIKPKVNISRAIAACRTFEYIRKCFKQTFYYLTSIPLTPLLKPKIDRPFEPEDFIELYVDMNRLENYFRMRGERLQNNRTIDTLNEMINQQLFAKDVDVRRALREQAEKSRIDMQTLANFVARHYNNDFMFPRNSESAVFCWFCKETGHIREHCFKNKIEKVDRAEEIRSSDLYSSISFDTVFEAMYKNDCITLTMSRKHKIAVVELSEIIRHSTGLDCTLRLFGSTVNRLGCSDSDLDICMTLAGNASGKGLNFVEILDKVYQVLASPSLADKVTKIEPILMARVPIIKFQYKGYDVDLSMYNQCGVYNSKLLRAYASIDSRLARLFYLVKRYAKACKIADASRGSLSSYAWSIMCIHYLQNTSPPILPILQETEAGDLPPKFGVAGWNVWFKEPEGNTYGTSNPIGLTSLFKGFFSYYSNFDFNLYVVSIRQFQPMTRFQKNWVNCMMAIEDPFELTHNLACRMDDEMAIYVINSFAQAHRHITSLQRRLLQLQNSFSSLQDSTIYAAKIFNGLDITGSNPPFRGCRLCHRIGHKVKDCPEKPTRKSKEVETKASPRQENTRGSARGGRPFRA